MNDEDDKARRARERRATWALEPTFQATPWASDTLADRLERLERLRRVAFAVIGVDYPESPTPRQERQRWPVERIG